MEASPLYKTVRRSVLSEKLTLSTVWPEFFRASNVIMPDPAEPTNQGKLWNFKRELLNGERQDSHPRNIRKQEMLNRGTHRALDNGESRRAGEAGVSLEEVGCEVGMEDSDERGWVRGRWAVCVVTVRQAGGQLGQRPEGERAGEQGLGSVMRGAEG